MLQRVRQETNELSAAEGIERLNRLAFPTRRLYGDINQDNMEGAKQRPPYGKSRREEHYRICYKLEKRNSHEKINPCKS